MPFAVARSRDEAHLFLDLHPCDACGSVDTTWEHGLMAVEGALASRYAGICAGCGAAREHLFGLPEREVVPKSFPTFGGTEPSELLDAGEWLWVAERTAQAVTSDDPAESRRVLAIATAAVEEVVKFIAPGEDEVPAHAFWSDLGRRERDAEPARFTLDRLLEMRRHYREQMRRYPTRKAESN